MDTEFERKFLVTDAAPSAQWPAEELDQGYLFSAVGYALRVRIARAAEREAVCTMTLKGPRSGLGRPEAEWEIPAADADQLLERSHNRVTKRRHTRHADGLMWTVDVFSGTNAGLVLAEIEGSEAAVAGVELPEWLGREVTEDVRYTNASLAEKPFSQWGSQA